ncbi:MAG TPA: porin family protein [Bacteroidales bacterium]|nr:porin family protein [Bacteroidales bacterium]HPS62831.1 porin family protein [Bacteroidales bacterium]
MRKYVVIIILAVAGLLLPHPGKSQFTVGLKAGYTASSLSSGLDSIKSSMLSGFHFGAFARLGKKVHLQPEIYYSLAGSTYENLGKGTVNDWKQKVRIGTLDIPVLVGFTFVDLKKFNWRIMVGPEASFVVNSSIKDLNLTGPVTQRDLNKVNWYLQAGTGIDFYNLTLDLRYQTGLNSLIREATGAGGPGYNVNTSAHYFVASIGFKFF